MLMMIHMSVYVYMYIYVYIYIYTHIVYVINRWVTIFDPLTLMVKAAGESSPME